METMSSFPFPRLPLLVQLEVIRNCEFPDLIEVSKCSEKIKKVIQAANISLKNFKISLYTEWAEIVFGFPRTNCKFKHSVETDCDDEMGNERCCVFTYKDSPDGIDHWNLDVLVRKDDFIGKVHDVLCGINKLFRITEVDYLTMTPSNQELLRQTVHPLFPTVSKLFVVMSDGSFKEEDLKWTLENMTVEKTISISCPVETGVSYSVGFRAKKIWIDWPSWIHLDAILNSTIELVHFEKDPPTSEFMNAILKAWISNEKLFNLKFFWWETDSSESFDGEEVMDGIEEAILTSEELIQNPLEDDFEEDFGKYIRRADGKLAVVSMSGFCFQLRIVD